MLLVLIVCTILIGCNTSSSESSIPEDISNENYKTFVESYELYEERVQQYNGQFVHENGELIDFSEHGMFEDTDLLEVVREHTEKIENGEEGILTKIEDELIHEFISLYFIKQIDYLTEDMKQMAIKTNPEYDDPMQTAISLEKKIIQTLKLEKEPVTATLQAEENSLNSKDSSERDPEELEQAYEPEYMSEAEWGTCIESEAYSIEECKNIDQYYTNGDGKRELEENQDMQQIEQGEITQELASEVQEYVVNIVNDLTIIGNMSSDIQSSNTNARIYGSGYSGDNENGPEFFAPDYEEEMNGSIKIIKDALNDIEQLNAPQNTTYIMLEPELDEFVQTYLTIIEDIETGQANSDSETVNDSIRELQKLDLEMTDFELLFAEPIIANHYLEYDALVHIWNEDKNYQSDDSTHASIPNGIKMQFFRNGIDFYQDIVQ